MTHAVDSLSFFPPLLRSCQKAWQTSSNKTKERLAQRSKAWPSKMETKERKEDGLQTEPVHTTRNPHGGRAASHSE